MQRGGKDVCVYFKHEVSVRERTVNSEVDINDIVLQTNAGLHSVSFPRAREGPLNRVQE